MRRITVRELLSHSANDPIQFAEVFGVNSAPLFVVAWSYVSPTAGLSPASGVMPEFEPV